MLILRAVAPQALQAGPVLVGIPSWCEPEGFSDLDLVDRVGDGALDVVRDYRLALFFVGEQ